MQFESETRENIQGGQLYCGVPQHFFSVPRNSSDRKLGVGPGYEVPSRTAMTIRLAWMGRLFQRGKDAPLLYGEWSNAHCILGSRVTKPHPCHVHFISIMLLDKNYSAVHLHCTMLCWEDVFRVLMDDVGL